jgi:hypothetical protein
MATHSAVRGGYLAFIIIKVSLFLLSWQTCQTVETRTRCLLRFCSCTPITIKLLIQAEASLRPTLKNFHRNTRPRFSSQPDDSEARGSKSILQHFTMMPRRLPYITDFLRILSRMNAVETLKCAAGWTPSPSETRAFIDIRYSLRVPLTQPCCVPSCPMTSAQTTVS